MSLGRKVVGTLLGVFTLYVIAAWLVLAHVQMPIFKRLESNNATDQLRRVNAYIEGERAAIDLFVIDWAHWDDTMEFVLGRNNTFYDEHLAGGYLGELGMSFSAILDRDDQLVWGEAYAADGEILDLEHFFPQGIDQDYPLPNPSDVKELTSGFVNTAHGPAIVSSAAILWNDAQGVPGGHLIAGKVLDANYLKNISRTMLSSIDIVPSDVQRLPASFRGAYEQLITGTNRLAQVEQNGLIHGLSLIQDIADKPIGLLSVAMPASISSLGVQTLRNTISLLVIAALILTLTLWFVLRRLLLKPINQLTHAFSCTGTCESTDSTGRSVLSAIKRMRESRVSKSTRNDEIGILFNAYRELSNSLLESTSTIWRAAHVDGLTGLVNRRLFMERAEDALHAARVNGKQKISFLFLDLDDFKYVNDTAGHSTGDQLLVAVASRLHSVVGTKADISPDDDYMNKLVARFGGDEFIVMLTNDTHDESASVVAGKIVEALAKPFFIGEDAYAIGACVGVAVYPEDSESLGGLLSIADASMYEAKRTGKGSWCRFSPAVTESTAEQGAMVCSTTKQAISV